LGRVPIRNALVRIRKLIAGWPETAERISHGAPTWWGGRKTFATFHSNHHGDGRIAVWCKASFEQQAELVEGDPENFFVPPYVGPSGWVGIRLDRSVDWETVAGLLLEGYRQVAPRRALALLERDGVA
jgi:hypothetical protein